MRRGLAESLYAINFGAVRVAATFLLFGGTQRVMARNRDNWLIRYLVKAALLLFYLRMLCIWA